MTDATKSVSFEFREVSYFTYPTPGQKRWWVDAMLRVGVSKPKYWMSDEIKFSQV